MEDKTRNNLSFRQKLGYGLGDAGGHFQDFRTAQDVKNRLFYS